jgi:16S rRNA processing protein RimM
MSGPTGAAGGAGRLVVGLVRGVHGLRGGLRVEVLSDEERRFEPGSVIFAEGSSEPLTVVEARPEKGGLVVRFAELPDRNSAEALRDTYLEAAAGELPAQTWYWHEIVGCRVTSGKGDELGTVDDVMRVGEAEVYVVNGPRGELLVPAVQSVVLELEPPAKRMVVDAAALGLEEA